MNKKELTKKQLTKKQLKKQLTTLTEAKGSVNDNLYNSMKDAFHALKNLKKALVGHTYGEDTITFRDSQKITAAKNFIEKQWEDMKDFDSTEKKTKKENEVIERNEKSEGHGKMYNALSGIREGKVIKINETTLRKIVGRVIKEQVEVEPDGIYLDPDVTMSSQIKQVTNNITGNILGDLAILIDDMGTGGADGKMMGTHEILDRLALMVDKINKNEYLTL